MKLKNLFYRIPRPLKACLCALLVMVLAVVYYIALGCPTTFRQEFRRAEKAHMVGPSTIVDTLNAGVCDYEKLLVGETEHGVCFFGRYGSSVSGTNHSGERHYQFTYCEKTGELTVLAAPNRLPFVWDLPGYDLPVYIFTDYTQAVRAEIELSIIGAHTKDTNGHTVTTRLFKTFTSEVNLLDPGVFRCIIISEDTRGSYALFHLACITSGNLTTANYISLTTATAKVWLYDAQDQLIAEQTLILHEPAQSSDSNT